MPASATILALAALLEPPPIAPRATTPVAFRKITLSRDFVAEGATIADFDRDGHADIAAGRFIWRGPAFSERFAFTPERDNADGPSRTPYRADTGYSDYFVARAHDFDGDGWSDILVYGLPGTPAILFTNPRTPAGEGGAERAWSRHELLAEADGESPDLADLDGDGVPELLCHTGGRFGYFTLSRANPADPATFHPIAPKPADGAAPVHRYTHGYGAGDVNGDGRTDILTNIGWFEQPATLAGDPAWTFHAADLGEGGAQMHAFDANGDGRADIVTSMKAHAYGLSWFERNADGSFTERAILGRTPESNANGVGFSQIHAVEVADIDGDGLRDIVCGKRRWAHGPMGDVEPMAPPVLCWFRLVRDADAPGGARFEKHLVDDDSGVGTQFAVADLDGDRRPDIAVSNKHGVFAFIRR